VSFWNDRTYLYVQAILWNDHDDALGPNKFGQTIGDNSALILDVDADRKITANVDRDYRLNPWPDQHGLRYTVFLGVNITTALRDNSKGRGAIRYLPGPSGSAKVRVDSLLIPLAEINKRPSEKLRLAYWGQSPRPALIGNSVGYLGNGDYFAFHLPWDRFHEVTLADRADALDIKAIPDGRDDEAPPRKE